ncbi:dTDP-4-dehydrorhamnose reductase [Thermodesulfobacteriota bacterium]
MEIAEKCLILGAKGMLGTDLLDLMQRSGVHVIGLDLEEIDIGSAESVERVFARSRPSLVVNVAAMTDVDACETAVDKAFRTNASGPENLAASCASHGTFLVHLSTDYVFDGESRSPYVEEHPTNPLGVYGKSKAEGELAVRRILPHQHCIVRTQWLFGLNGKNFVEAILGLAVKTDTLKVVDDQMGSPTSTIDLADALVRLINLEASGTYHVTNSHAVTWHGFAEKILQIHGIRDVRVEPITTAQLGRPAPRPKNSVLSNSKFAQLAGSSLRPWEEALSHYLELRAGLERTT